MCIAYNKSAEEKKTIEQTGIIITKYENLAKCISVIRKYNPISMAEIKDRIRQGSAVYAVGIYSLEGLKTLLKCNDELMAAGVETSFLYGERMVTLEFLRNTLRAYTEVDAYIEWQNEVGDY